CHTMRIPVVEGRRFNAGDNDGAPRVAVINETFARRMWPSENALGKLFREENRTYQVVGITREGKVANVGEDPLSFAFYPLAQSYAPQQVFHVRAHGRNSGELIEQVKRAVSYVDPNVAVENPTSLQTVVEFSLFPQRIASWLV